RIAEVGKEKKVVEFECYQGVNDGEILPMLEKYLAGEFYSSKDSMHPDPRIQQLINSDVTDDEVFGYITRLQMPDFFDGAKVSAVRERIDRQTSGLICLYGPGALL